MRLRLDSFAKNNAVLFLSASFVSFSNFLYQWLMLRAASREAFSALNSLFSLLVIISVPAAAFNLMVTKQVGMSHAKNDFVRLRVVWQALAKHAFYFSSCVFALIVIFSRKLAAFLNINSPLSVMILGGVFFLSLMATVINGGLQGLEKFKVLAFSAGLAGFLKLGLSLGLIRYMPELEGGLCAFLLAILAGIIICLKPAFFLFEKTSSAQPFNFSRPYFYILPVFAVSACFAVLTNLDMLLVKHFFLTEAQDYSVAQMVGKIVLFIPGTIYIVMFSRSCRLHASGLHSGNILKRSILFTLILSLCAVILFNIFPQRILGLLTPGYNKQIIGLARYFSFAMLFYALSNVLFYYQLSVERYDFIKPLIIVTAGIFVFLWFFHRDTFRVINTMFIGSLVIFLLNLKTALKASASYGEH